MYIWSWYVISSENGSIALKKSDACLEKNLMGSFGLTSHKTFFHKANSLLNKKDVLVCLQTGQFFIKPKFFLKRKRDLLVYILTFPM